MNSTRDPTTMTASNRLSELAEAFANAYLRLLASRKESQNPLAESGQLKARQHFYKGK